MLKLVLIGVFFIGTIFQRGLTYTNHLQILSWYYKIFFNRTNKHPMQKNAAFFLKMSGYVQPGKHKEFEQTFKFVSNQLSTDCVLFSLSLDIFTADTYHFHSIWSSAESLHKFLQSPEYQVLQGAFQTLGSPVKNSSGKLVDIKLFEETMKE